MFLCYYSYCGSFFFFFNIVNAKLLLISRHVATCEDYIRYVLLYQPAWAQAHWQSNACSSENKCCASQLVHPLGVKVTLDYQEPALWPADLIFPAVLLEMRPVCRTEDAV